MELGIRKNYHVKVYLDDEREAPEGWTRVKTPAQAIALLETGTVRELSLDHDLGDDEGIGTGYDVVLWLEEETHNNINFDPPEVMKVHSANVSARTKMEQGLAVVRRLDFEHGDN